MSRDQPREVGDEITIGSERGLVPTIEPLFGEREFLLVVQLRRDYAAPA